MYYFFPYKKHLYALKDKQHWYVLFKCHWLKLEYSSFGSGSIEKSYEMETLAQCKAICFAFSVAPRPTLFWGLYSEAEFLNVIGTKV